MGRPHQEWHRAVGCRSQRDIPRCATWHRFDGLRWRLFRNTTWSWNKISNIYVYIYVCMYVSIYICMYVSIYICTCIYIYVSIYIYIYLSIYIHVSIYICIYLYIYVCIYVHCINNSCEMWRDSNWINIGEICFVGEMQKTLDRFQAGRMSIAFDDTSCADVPSLEMATLRNAACHGEMSGMKKEWFWNHMESRLILSWYLGYLWISVIFLPWIDTWIYWIYMIRRY